MIRIAEKDSLCRISLSVHESAAVKRAAADLCRDVEKICGCRAVLLEEETTEKADIYLGTLGVGKHVSRQAGLGRLNTEGLRDQEGKYRWEGYVLQEIDESLYIAGADRRGTIYGIYEFTCMEGVSPWYYFADVPVKRKDRIEIKKNFYKWDYPSVKYRGIFLNDEEELNAWAKKHTGDDTIGPEAYAHIFELLLRLKANYIWPAMHVNYFNGDPENGRLADEMGIVVGTSHCDMLLRSNQNEWHPWLKSKGYREYEDVVYDYSVPGRNREILQEYWRESVEQNKNYEVCYTVGMRGIHDTGFLTGEIDRADALTPEEKEAQRVKLLETVISDQRDILKQVLGEESGETFQTFVPYKEVLPLYDRGLNVPDDVTIIWVNDNHGYVRRYPDVNERKRKGGHGLYYHNSYWAPPPMSYLFIGSIPLAHTGIELKKAYESGIQKLWVLNVGALKPLEQDMEFFIRYAWEAGKDEGLTKDTDLYTEEWINRNFSGGHGKEAAEIYNIYAQVTNVRKVEHMDNDVFSQTAYGNEAGRRILKLQEMFDRANRIYEALPEEEKAAFFQMFLMKIHASYFTNYEYYYADRSRLSYDRGNMQAADRYIRYSQRMAGLRRWMIYYYNKIMLDGKWDEILTPEKFPPPTTAMYPAGKPALFIGEAGLSVYADGQKAGDKAELFFYPEGIKRKALEIGNTGKGKIPYRVRVTKGQEWLRLDGDVEKETDSEELVTVEPDKCGWGPGARECEIEVTDEKNGVTTRIPVHLVGASGYSGEYDGFIEADGYVSMNGTDYARNVSGEEAGWEIVRHIGRCGGDAVMAHHSACMPLDSSNVKENPYLEYHFFTRTHGKYLIEITRFMTLNSTGKIRIGVGLDGKEPVIAESQITDEWVGSWKECVMNNGEKLLLRMPHTKKGEHVLRIYMIDNYFTFSKIVIYTGERTASNLGPERSWRSGEKTRKAEGACFPQVQWEKLIKEMQSFYGYDEERIPLLPVVYAAKDFWEKDILYMKNEQYSQKALGEKKYAAAVDESGAKDVTALFGSGIFEEQSGVLAIEAEYVLEDSPWAYRTCSTDGRNISWTHLQAETNGGTGLAMYLEEKGIFWDHMEEAPGMHYKIRVSSAGVYHIWLLLRFYDEESDACGFALDGNIQPLEAQPSGGNLFTYSTSQIYFWSLVTDMEIGRGEHILSILGRKSGIRIDRIYLTRGEERPWMDADWKDSPRITD